MNNLKISLFKEKKLPPVSVDIKNIIIKYTLPPINKTIRNELNKVFPYYIGTLKEYLDNNYIIMNSGGTKIIKNFNITKYKIVKVFLKPYWTLRLKTDFY
jgi:hypothetical protein